ncbi:MAG: phospholipase D-like domain-containing protein [Candidatus Euphemobacter frigidus]|nr:phospholipase D-like domain-containing protein [Candidatus Euphemobacter frigidus]MDP8276751.1 phospholipase D-like domain-containing protein [Candidatus Euphemobacter frigidus]
MTKNSKLSRQSLLILLLALFSSCTPPGPEVKNEGMPNWCRVYFTPRDPVVERMISLIDNARERVWAAFYSFTLDEVARALLRAQGRGVDVRVIMDDSSARPSDSQSHLLRKRGLLKTDFAPSDFMHNKFMVIDSCLTWTGSYNPGETGSFRDNNNVIVISSARVTANYEDEFLEMWEGHFGKDSPGPTEDPRIKLGHVTVETYFAPEDPCERRLIELIKGARKSIRFATFAFTLEPVAEALLDRHLAGVDVKGVMERGQNSPWCCYRIFEDGGINIRWDQNLYYLHHKFFVIDGKIVVTGSFNPTKHAGAANDENMLIVHHPAVARKYLREFNRLWERKWE